MEAALKEVIDKGAKGIILDLRYNPGGLLNSVTSVSDMFLDKGVIVVEKEASGRETKVESAPASLPRAYRWNPPEQVQRQRLRGPRRGPQRERPRHDHRREELRQRHRQHLEAVPNGGVLFVTSPTG